MGWFPKIAADQLPYLRLRMDTTQLQLIGGCLLGVACLIGVPVAHHAFSEQRGDSGFAWGLLAGPCLLAIVGLTQLWLTRTLVLAENGSRVLVHHRLFLAVLKQEIGRGRADQFRLVVEQAADRFVLVLPIGDEKIFIHKSNSAEALTNWLMRQDFPTEQCNRVLSSINKTHDSAQNGDSIHKAS